MFLKTDRPLIGPDGRPVFGPHDGPLTHMNIDSMRPYGRPALFSFQKHLNRFGLKRWHYLGAVTHEMVFGMAFVHTGYLANVFTYVFDRQTRKTTEESHLIPLGLNCGWEGSPSDGTLTWQTGKNRLKIELQPARILLSLTLSSHLDARIVFNRHADPLSLTTRSGLRGFHYTCKETAMECTGAVRTRDGGYNLLPGSLGISDYSYGYPPRRTFWNWAAGTGHDQKGRTVGFNFSQGINETAWSENVFWVDGKRVMTGGMNFIYNDLNLLDPWIIRSVDGKSELTFKPEGERKADLEMGLIASRYFQPFGTFSGHLSDGKNTIELNDAAGFTEEHEAVW